MKSCVLAFAFGAPRKIRSNEIIAQIASKKARELDAVVFTQYDILLEEGVDAIRPNEIDGKPPYTYELASKAIRWAKKEGIKKILVVAAPPHLTRCLRDLSFLVWEKNLSIEIEVCEEMKNGKFNANDWFCKESTQEHTTHWWWWWTREIPTLLIPFPLYRRRSKR